MGACKYQIKRLVSSIASNLIKYQKKYPQREGFRILNYHSVTKDIIPDDRAELTTPLSLFERHLELLMAEGYNIASCEELISSLINQEKITAKTVALTLDDGFSDSYSNAFPVLRKFHLKATFFIVSDYLNKPGYLKLSEVREMDESGIINFACHGLTHRKLANLDDSDLKTEIYVAKERLEKIFRHEINLFAYPFGCFGSYNNRAVKLVESAGFSGAFTSVFGLNTAKTDRFLLKRNRMSWCADEAEFRKHLEGAYDWYPVWQAIQVWMN